MLQLCADLLRPPPAEGTKDKKLHAVPMPRKDAMVMVAEVVARTELHHYVKGAFPERPVDLPVDDEQIRTAIVAAQRARPSKDDVELMRRYVRWRNVLMDAESRAKNNLRFLAGCWEDLRIQADPYLQSCALKIHEHVVQHFDCDLHTLPAAYSEDQDWIANRDLWFGHAVRRTDLVATWLLYGLPSPRFIPRERLPQHPDEQPTPHWSEGDERQE